MKNQVINYLYTKLENHKYNLSIGVTLNVNNRLPKLTLMNFVRPIKCTGIASTYFVKFVSPKQHDTDDNDCFIDYCTYKHLDLRLFITC